MEIRTVLLAYIFLILGVSFSNAQININIDSDCLVKNTVIFTKALIELKGSDYVASLLEHDFQAVMIYDIELNGTVLKLSNLRSTKKLPDGLSKVIEKELTPYLIDKNIHFFICISNDFGEDKDIVLERVIKNEIYPENRHGIVFGFPGELYFPIRYYNKKKDTNQEFSKYEYLLEQINKYE